MRWFITFIMIPGFAWMLLSSPGHAFTIDWDNPIPCTGELVISPAPYCVGGEIPNLPPEKPPTSVPVPGTLPLLLVGVSLLALRRRKQP